jgi:aminoglycoside phosphotransferase (APT) family kinase protein
VTAPWTHERVVSPELAAALIAAQFPALAPPRMGKSYAGWDNTVHEVNEAWMFRFPRREIAVPLLANEIRALPRVATALPVPVAVPELVGAPTPDFPWPFAGYRKLAGEPADRARLDDVARARLAAPLGAFLAALHALDPAPLDLPGDDFGRVDIARHRARLAERLDALAARGLVADAHAWDAELDAAPARGPRSFVVHGDLYARHLLLDGDSALAGVIDWGDVHIGDPSCDLAIAHAFLPAAAHAAFRRAYGPIDPDTWRLARLRALVHAAAELIYALDIEDQDILAEARAALSYLGASQSS